MLYSCELIWATAKFHMYTLLKTLLYVMKSQIKLNYIQETKGSNQPHGAVSRLFVWTEVCIKVLSPCRYCCRKGKGRRDVPMAGHFLFGKGWIPGRIHKSSNSWSWKWELSQGNRNIVGKNWPSFLKECVGFHLCLLPNIDSVTCYSELDLPQWNPS